MGRSFWPGFVAILSVGLTASGLAFWFCWSTTPSQAPGGSPASLNSSSVAAFGLGTKATLPKGRLSAFTPEALRPLPLKLLGLLIRSQAKESIAVIRDLERQMSGLYRIGDRLPHGETLITIASGKVTLRRSDGSLAVLPLEAVDRTAGGMIGQGVVTPLSKRERLIDSEALQKVALPVLLELSQVKVKPAISQGRFLGFGVEGTASDGLLNALGVEEGDVISSINGKPLDNYRRATQLLGQALHQAFFKVTLLKKDQKETFTYHLAP